MSTQDIRVTQRAAYTEAHVQTAACRPRSDSCKNAVSRLRRRWRPVRHVSATTPPSPAATARRSTHAHVATSSVQIDKRGRVLQLVTTLSDRADRRAANWASLAARLQFLRA
eukprot:1457658-Prymnesium_polylepis.1